MKRRNYAAKRRAFRALCEAKERRWRESVVEFMTRLGVRHQRHA